MEQQELLPQNFNPTTCFVDQDGILIGNPVDGTHPDDYQKVIDNYLKAK